MSPETTATPAMETASTADREIVITRLLNAPRELVFQAWTDPEHVDKWWGPTGFTNETYEMDVRPGGVWRYMMHGPDGVDYPSKNVFVEVVRPERLVYDHGWDREGAGPDFRATATFEEEGGKTRLTMRMVFPTAAARDYVVREVKAIEGGNQTVDRLAAYLERM
jgi:uncharacterized protein YndB with AHSA1/START domain